MIVLVFTDLRERILPDAVNYTGFALGLLLSLFTAPADGTAGWIAKRILDFPPPAPVLSFADAIFGAAIGSGLLWLVSEAYFRMRGREGMGMGDVKMMLMAGAFLGVKRTLLTILAGSLLGSILGLAFILIAAEGVRLRIAVWDVSWLGGAPYGVLRHAGRQLVSESLLMVR